MCMLCIEIAKRKMTAKEIASAYIETVHDEKHAEEVAQVMKDNGVLGEVLVELLDMAAKPNGTPQ